ncbi:hypothetical protein KIPB_016096, partial [Kipferlia bialata]
DLSIYAADDSSPSSSSDVCLGVGYGGMVHPSLHLERERENERERESGTRPGSQSRSPSPTPSPSPLAVPGSGTSHSSFPSVDTTYASVPCVVTERSESSGDIDGGHTPNKGIPVSRTSATLPPEVRDGYIPRPSSLPQARSRHVK